MMPEIPVNIPHQRMSLFALGFRPFFLGAGFSALLLLAAWIGMLEAWIPFGSYYSGGTWHAYEMLFGYTAAAIAGFLLTAVRNWTGIETPTGIALAALTGLWLAGRIAPFLPLPEVAVAALNVAFFPALALSLYQPLWHGRNKVNRVFLALLAVMTIASLLVHLQAIGVTQDTAPRGIRLMLDATLLTLLIVSGRVMPFFTERGVAGAQPRSRVIVERFTFALASLWLVTNLLLLSSELAGAIALSLALVQAMRLAGWHDARVWSIPILAVLYAGYIWLIVGFALDGLAGLGHLPAFPAFHALTVGALGGFTLGMMARVSLGHTGRAMRSSMLTNIAFILLNAAAWFRVFMALFFPAQYGTWTLASGTLWTLAFALFLWVYVPILIAPRADGRPD
ncbi:NnrS family protein [Candidatus Thiosymbion oneisti]|uniref:NnrS family protein n=2 Tax=Candidatus Thiosymbion oneisti TaxID=589554 RepID=UPI001FB6F4AA|nr:NnrS family protein [Candidatus Thiosymbion oneisti]